MAINFPSSPTIGLTTTTGSKTWEWTGEGWKLQALPGAQGLQGTQGGGGQGLQGTQGVGSQGLQGTQGGGGQGLQGTQGVGSQGLQGTQGVGSQGLQGTQGVGSQGIQGTQGIQGLQGLSIQGVQGPSGSAGGGGSDITVQDEGSVVGSAVTTFNFVGSGVAASHSGGIATINISGGGGGSTSWSRKTANYTAVAGDQLIADTTGGTFSITLPSSPSSGDTVKIADGGDWTTTNLTVGRNGSNIEGATNDFLLDIKGIIVEFVYEDATDGWQVYAYTGPGGSGTGYDVLESMLFA